MTDLEHKLSGCRELQKHVVRIARRRRRTVAVVSTDPDKALRIDINSVLPLRPVVTIARSTPALNVAAGGIEFQHRRRRFRLLLGRNRTRTMQDPNMVV